MTCEPIPGLDTTDWTLQDHSDFWRGFIKEYVLGLIRRQPTSQSTERTHS